MRRPTVIAAASLATAASLAAAPARAQPPIAERPLPAPARTWSHEFTNVLLVQPLADGSAFALDIGEAMVVRLDARTGAAARVGRTGAGPLEYRQPGQMVRLPGDTIVIYDSQLARLLYVSPQGAPVRSTPYAKDIVSALGKPQPLFADARGHWYGLVLPPLTPGKPFTLQDSMPVARMDGATAATWDTVTRVVFQGQAGMTPTMGGDGKLHLALPLADLLPADDLTLLPDGRLVVLRGDRYALEWYGADGGRQRTVTVGGTRYPITAADRARIAADTRRTLEDAIKLQLRNAPAGAQIPEIVIDDPATWPERTPLTRRGMRAGDDGRLYVPVSCQRVSLVCVDVLDANGTRLARWRLPEGARFLAAGRGTLHVVTKDEDDLQYVNVYRVP